MFYFQGFGRNDWAEFVIHDGVIDGRKIRFRKYKTTNLNNKYQYEGILNEDLNEMSGTFAHSNPQNEHYNGTFTARRN